MVTMNERLTHEIEHGATEAAVAQAEYGWDSAAGKLRRSRRIEFLVRDVSRHAKVLEVGAGTGLQTMGLLAHVDSVVGIDISPHLLQVAERRAPGARYLVMDAHQPDFEPESFDAIVGVSILHHLDWERALTSYLPLLKPGGLVRFSEPNLVNPQIYLQKNIPFLKRLAGDSPDEYAFSRWEIARVLRRAGYVDISVDPFEFLHPSTPEKWIPHVTRVEEILSRTPLREIAGSLLIQARKAS